MKNILFILLISLLSVGCKIGHTTSHTEKHLQKQERYDTIFVEKIQKINDTIFIKIPVIQSDKKECDTICQREIEKILSQIASKKQSGNNTSGIYYDKYQQQLILYQDLQEQFSVYKSNNQKDTEIKEIEVIKEIPVPYVPKFIQFLAWCGGFSVGILMAWLLGLILGKTIKIR